MLPQHPASWVFLLALTEVERWHTQKSPELGVQQKQHGPLQKSLIREQKRKKSSVKSPQFFNNSKECLELLPRPEWSKNCGAAGLAGGRTWVAVSPELVGFPARIGPWSQPINRRPKGNKGKAEKPAKPKFEQKPAKVCTNRIALQTCNQSA